ncbi:MAG TPA: lytic murein transglycosylase [Solirubrobacterales bacterium]|nr:lytic murein transglycosylase [Solirubrobacterales bacterium]
MSRIRNTLLTAALGAALAAPTLASADTVSGAGQAPAALSQGDTLAAPQIAPATGNEATQPGQSGSGGTTVGAGEGEAQATADAETVEEPASSTASPTTTPAFSIPAIAPSSCAVAAVPSVLVPIYQRASLAYDLGPQGPSVLAGINAIETAFGTNLNVSSAGAQGWMQFMPSTWESYGVDANGDGVKDPYNPEDAIFAAARYLSAAGMPADTYNAIFAYNHADWYVAEVLSNADCYAPELGTPAFSPASLAPQMPVLSCSPAPAWHKDVPANYLAAFEAAAARYDLGRRGVWALAAIARLESNFGKGMDKQQLRSSGPLGLDETEWSDYAVDGNDDGRIRHASVADSAATLARLIWSRGSLRAGVFTHNQAAWYVEEVMEEAEEMEGKCEVTYVDWKLAPLASAFETPGSKAALVDGLASVPADAPAAVKSAIGAANAISTTPYIWGGGHGSWYSTGYDCSGAVSFALWGAGLLDRPMTSGELESYGEPGPGRWITIYASPTHTYAVIAGLRWDTVGDAEGTGPRWHLEPPYPDGFVVRHPAGY